MDIARSLLILAALGAAAAGREDTVIRYHVSLTDAQAHRVNVQMSLEGLTGPSLELSMPVWTPGSYLVREYARNVIWLTATDADGAELAVTKTAKDTWRVASEGAAAVSVHYELYANEVSVRTSHVDDSHAHLHPAATFLRHERSAGLPHRVQVARPPDWGVFSSLTVDGDDHVAADYDELIDSPIEVGPHDELTFEVNDVPHRVVLAGVADLDYETLLADMTEICEEVADIFGQMPFEHYTFIVPLVDEGGGGLEHVSSSVCMANRWKLDDKAYYRRFLSLIAHEYFHAWNVKRFRPESLGPFDYDRENYTTDLWVAEGITSYIDDLCTLRAGFADKVSDYLSERAKAFRAESERPGSARMSLERASFDAWIKHYRPDENSANVAVSYYTKGGLVALMLDLRMLRLSQGRAGLTEALRLGWQRYTEKDQGFPEGAFQALAEEACGADLSGFFDDYVRGTAPLSPDADLAWVGLRLTVEPEKTERTLPVDDGGFALEPWLGISTADARGLCRVDVVTEGGPAFRAGLNHDDLLLALNDMRVAPDSFQERLDRCAGEPSVTVSFWRGQDLRTLELEPELRRLSRWSVVSVDEPSDQQLMAFETWCGWPHPSVPEPTEDG